MVPAAMVITSSAATVGEPAAEAERAIVRSLTTARAGTTTL